MQRFQYRRQRIQRLGCSAQGTFVWRQSVCSEPVRIFAHKETKKGNLDNWLALTQSTSSVKPKEMTVWKCFHLSRFVEWNCFGNKYPNVLDAHSPCIESILQKWAPPNINIHRLKGDSKHWTTLASRTNCSSGETLRYSPGLAKRNRQWDAKERVKGVALFQTMGARQWRSAEKQKCTLISLRDLAALAN